VITIDGPAGAGKTTTARGVASALAYRYLDTGALYRGLALAALRAGESDADSPATLKAVRAAHMEPYWHEGEMGIRLAGEDVSGAIRAPEVTRLVSPLSALPAVREILLPVQRKEGNRGRLVADGRDTGSVVFPGADLKVFLTADVEERSKRRSLELAAAGIVHDLAEVKREIEERDRRDSSRPLAPLTFPEGGVEVDTTGMTITEQVDTIVSLARERGA